MPHPPSGAASIDDGALTDFVRALPKAELHVHLEGTIGPETLLRLAERHGLRPPADDLDGVRSWYRTDSFEQFLERYSQVIGHLRSADDLALVAEDYLHDAHRQGIVHVEFHVSASSHIVEYGRRWNEVSDAVVAGCRRAGLETGMSWALIPDVAGHLPIDACVAAMAQVFARPGEGVVAIGATGAASRRMSEGRHPVLDRARAEGLHVVAHAGQHGGADEVRHAIETLGVERIQHGIGAMGDPAVVALLIDRGIACDVCPGSNLALGAAADAASHPLPAMIAAGIEVTLGSDDPPFVDSTLLDEYERARTWCDLDADGLRALAAASLRHSFASVDAIERWLTTLAATPAPPS